MDSPLNQSEGFNVGDLVATSYFSLDATMPGSWIKTSVENLTDCDDIFLILAIEPNWSEGFMPHYTLYDLRKKRKGRFSKSWGDEHLILLSQVP